MLLQYSKTVYANCGEQLRDPIAHLYLRLPSFSDYASHLIWRSYQTLCDFLQAHGAKHIYLSGSTMASFWRPHMTPARIAAEQKRNKLIAARRDAEEGRGNTATIKARPSDATSRKTSKAATAQSDPDGKPGSNVSPSKQADQAVSGVQARTASNNERATTPVSMVRSELSSSTFPYMWSK